MDHDTGNAPNVMNDSFCFLSGCKMNTVEVWAKEGSWVIGIGGNGTHKPDKLIYAMKVHNNLPINEFKKQFPEIKNELINTDKATNVLISREFYYLGDNALNLPCALQHLIISAQGCRSKVFKEDDVQTLVNFLHNQGVNLERMEALTIQNPEQRRVKARIRKPEHVDYYT